MKKIFLSILSLATGKAAVDDGQATFEPTEAELNDIKAGLEERDSLRAELSTAKTALEAATAAKATLEGTIATQKTALDAATTAKTKAETDLATAKGELATLKGEATDPNLEDENGGGEVDSPYTSKEDAFLKAEIGPGLKPLPAAVKNLFKKK